LPQDFGVYPRVTAEAMLDHLAVLKGIVNAKERRDAVQGLLNQVNLWNVRKKALSGYSGGMRQRFGIAQALLGQPKLVIVDEPTAGLDPEERNRFLNLLAAIGEDVVVILSTHIVEDVAQLCSNMAILAGGKVVRQGAPEDLRRSMQGQVWRAAVGRDELAGARERYTVISERLVGGRTVIHVLSPSQPSADFTAVEGGLEDVYFSTLAASRAA
jgi:ABC-type multidrug transport system ATPase subunit